MLPNKDTKLWFALLKELERAYTADEIQSLAEKYGYSSANSFNTILRQNGLASIHPRERIVLTEREPYPPLQIKPFKLSKENRDSEDIGIVLSDHHGGKTTQTYNSGIYQDRMEFLCDSVMDIINLHKPVKRAFIWELGDMVQGENPWQGSKACEIEMSAEDQIHELAIPTQTRFLTTLKQGVEEIFVFGVRGNHGKYSKEANPKTNWDSMFYKGLASSLKNQKGITIVSSGEWCQLVNIKGWRFFSIHGDQVMSTQGVPLFALRRKFQEWFAYFGGFHYGYCGHWHSGGHDHINSIATYDICPPLVTGDEWALERIGRASKPIQLCFGIHERYGRTWEYKLYADKGFLPEKYAPREGENYYE